MTRILTYILSSIHALRANYMRSALTMLGIVIGVSSVVLVSSIGQGTQALIVSQISSVGTNLLGILPGKSDANGPPAAVLGIVTRTLTADDVEAIGEIPGILAATGYVSARGQMSSPLKNYDSTLIGVSASYPVVEDQEMSAGRFFSLDEERRQARVTVLGADVKTELFGDSDPVGQTVRFKNLQLMVIGVAKKRGAALFGDFDKRSYVPIGVVQKEVVGINYVNFARAKFTDPDMNAQLQLEVARILRRRHRITNPDQDDFSVRSTAQGIEILSGITGAIAAFLLAITAISLLVGGIGIMNIMLVAISERFREIGLRKALGASNKTILAQFLIESIIISVIAGIIGILFGALLAYLIAIGVRSAGYAWEFIMQPGDVAVAVGVSAAIGILAGLYPAVSAARLEPTEALKSQ